MPATKERKIVDSYRTGTVSRSAVRAAVQKVKAAGQKAAKPDGSLKAPRLRRIP